MFASLDLVCCTFAGLMLSDPLGESLDCMGVKTASYVEFFDDLTGLEKGQGFWSS